MATSVEVFWPDGRSVARALEPSEINSVQEIHYPRDEEEVTPTVEIEVHKCFIVGFSMFFILNKLNTHFVRITKLLQTQHQLQETIDIKLFIVNCWDSATVLRIFHRRVH